MLFSFCGSRWGSARLSALLVRMAISQGEHFRLFEEISNEKVRKTSNDIHSFDNIIRNLFLILSFVLTINHSKWPSA